MKGITPENNQKEQQKKLSLFSCTKLSKFYFIPLMVPILCMLYNFLLNMFIINNGKYEEIKFYLTKIIFITRILGGSLHFVLDKINETKSTKNLKEYLKGKISPSLIFNNVEKFKFKKALKIIIVLSIIELFIIEFAFLAITYFDFRLFYLIFIVFLSYKISGTTIFLHQKISIVFSTLALFIVFISTILYTQATQTTNWFLILILGIISSIFYALMLIGHKYLMEELFISPFLLLFMTGLINFIFDFIFNICYDLITGENLGNIITNLVFLINGENKKKCIIYFIFMVIVETIYFVFVKLTLFYFSPTLLVITDLISPVLQLILNLIDNGFNKHYLLSIIGYSISLISAIFYNELIVCNFLGLNENTAKNIRKRGLTETSKILIDERNSINESYCYDYEDDDKEEKFCNEAC